MTTMDGYMNCMKLAHLLSIISLNLRAPFHIIVLIIKLLNMHTREKK